MTKTLLAAAAFALLATSASATEIQCVPKNVAARVLKSANPNDFHPQFSGLSYIGESSTFVVKGRSSDLGVTYFSGDYISPRGAVTKNVFAISSEWECGK